MLPNDLLDRVRKAISQELEVPLESLSDSASLRSKGLDSVAAATIVFRLESELGLEIDIRRLAGIDSIQALKDFLLKEFSQKGSFA
jgi:acyl carrier protein